MKADGASGVYQETPVTESYVVGVYWPEKWRRLLTGLSAAELTIVSAVALKMRQETRKGGLLG